MRFVAKKFVKSNFFLINSSNCTKFLETLIKPFSVLLRMRFVTKYLSNQTLHSLITPISRNFFLKSTRYSFVSLSQCKKPKIFFHLKNISWNQLTVRFHVKFFNDKRRIITLFPQCDSITRQIFNFSLIFLQIHEIFRNINSNSLHNE